MSIRKGDVVISGSGSGGSALNVDDRTTSLNVNDEIQAIGTIEKNKSDVKYDWVGTEAEWIAAKSAGTIDDDWICYITDDAVAVNKRQRTIGEIIYSLIPLDDPALHLLDGSLIDGTGVYNQFYTYMKNLYENGYDKCFTSEADWQASDAAYNACGKFVLDVSNQTIRLPEVQGIVEGTLDEDALGELVEAGLPNITGTLSGVPAQTTSLNITYGSGAFANTKTSASNQCNSGGASQPTVGANLDASRSNSIYGNSTTVQPQTIKGFYYIVLATDVNLSLTLDTDSLVNDVNHLQSEVSGADYVVEYKAPSSSDSSWYRLYKSGWIEQGGRAQCTTSTSQVINFSKEMNDTNYSYQAVMDISSITGSYNLDAFAGARTTASMTVWTKNGNGQALTTDYYFFWEVKGMAKTTS